MGYYHTAMFCRGGSLCRPERPSAQRIVLATERSSNGFGRRVWPQDSRKRGLLRRWGAPSHSSRSANPASGEWMSSNSISSLGSTAGVSRSLFRRARMADLLPRASDAEIPARRPWRRGPLEAGALWSGLLNTTTLPRTAADRSAPSAGRRFLGAWRRRSSGRSSRDPPTEITSTINDKRGFHAGTARNGLGAK